MTPFFKLLTSEVLPLTKELAEEFKSMAASPTERLLDKGRVKHLKDKVLAGQAVTFQWVTANLGELTLRMNGNHSSNALCELNGSFPDGLMVHREAYEVPDEASLAYLFRQFDDRKSGRSPSDVSGAYQGLHEPLREVNRHVAKHGIEGIVWYRRFVEGIPVPNGDDIYSMFAEAGTHGFLRWLGETLNMKTPELTRAPIVSAMYGTYNASETGARAFWSSVARGGAEFDETAPATVLDTWLKDQKDNKNPNRRVTPGQLYQGCVYAWNAFREEQSPKIIKYDNKKGFNDIHH